MATNTVFNLNLIAHALPILEKELLDIRTAPERPELEHIDADTAFELGYETAIHDLKQMMLPDPMDVILVGPVNIDIERRD